MVEKPTTSTAPGEHEAVLALLDKEPRGVILDLGSGEGALAYSLAQKNFQVFACDKSSDFKPTDIPWTYWDLNSNAVPYDKDFFDYVACIEVIEHLENPHQLIRLIRTILKDGGKLILGTPNIMSISSRVHFVRSGWFSFFEENEPRHINPVPFWELERILVANGFSIEVFTTNKFLKLAKALRAISFDTIFKPKNKIILEGNILIIVAKKDK